MRVIWRNTAAQKNKINRVMNEYKFLELKREVNAIADLNAERQNILPYCTLT